ncbi:alpha/beta hydrolase [Aggregicoccus sp. 17bor-14]|nr:alpha/beta hydrolase [Simulacricoccus sp. 17bor-14]MRI88904.1 alpha/beta hydrolase [Aggregicoccus sp. 17bor-14]
MLGVLNGVLGDYLQRTGNGLATAMALHVDHRPVALEPAALRAAFPRASPRVALWVHGLGVTEAVWGFPGAPQQSYPAMLERDAGYTPLTLRYNTGLHISENGAALSALLGQLVAHFPVPIEELVLVGYSMGGLVLRSACHVAAEAQAPWLSHVRRAVYLGAPHLGAPLERLGQGVAHLLRALPSAYTRLVAEVLDLRSSGVKDLGFANLLQQDWDGATREQLLRNRRHPVPLLPGISHHLVVGTLGRHERHLLSLLFGDGMVRVASAAGRAPGGHPSPLFPQEHVAVMPGVDHLGLAHHPDVYARLRAWLEESP